MPFARTILTVLKRCLGAWLISLLIPAGAWAGCGHHVVTKGQLSGVHSDLAAGPAPLGPPKIPCGPQCSKNQRPTVPWKTVVTPSACDLLLALDSFEPSIEGDSFFLLVDPPSHLHNHLAGLYRPPREFIHSHRIGA